MSDLLQQMMEAGLIQFGSFPRNGVSIPVQFHFDMLASYPDVLEAAATELSRRLPSVDRLMCPFDSVPLGVALALKTGIPLVYSQGGTQEAVYDLVGAYDIGHPAAFVTNIAGITDYSALLSSVRRVGLDVQHTIALVNLGTAPHVTTLFHLDEIVTVLVERGSLPSGQAQVVKDWLAVLS